MRITAALKATMGSVLVVSSWAVLSGCSESSEDKRPWPGQSCASSRFRYHVMEADLGLCPEQPERLEEHATVMTSLLGLSDTWAPGNYYKYESPSHLRSAGACGSVADACTFWPDVHTTLALDEHELVHLYSRNKWKPALLAEGAAEGLTCRSSAMDAGCTSPWRDLVSAQHDRQTYDCGARLVYQLLALGEPARLGKLAVATGGSQDPDVFARAISQEYGVELDELWQTRVLIDARRCVPYFACAGSELQPGVTPVDEPGSARYRLPTAGGSLVNVRFRKLDAEAWFQIASCRATLEVDPDDGWASSNRSASDVWLEARAGSYALIMRRGSADISVEPGSFATRCDAARSHTLEAGRPLVFQMRSDGRTLYFRLEMTGPAAVEHIIGGFPASPVASASFCRSCAPGSPVPADCTALDIQSALAPAPTLDNGILVVQTKTEPASSGFLTLRLK